MMRYSCASLLIILLTCSPAQAQIGNEDALEKCINKALKYLDQVQEPDGSWRLGQDKTVAATSLAVMAFLSAGHVPGEGKYGARLEKAVRWVADAQLGGGGAQFPGQFNAYEMYSQGIATLMLAEVAGMTDAKLAPMVKKAIEKGVKLILKAQRSQGQDKGGWRYSVEGYDSDLSVTGWQLLALKAAKNLGCDVPAEKIQMAVDYVKRSHNKASGGFCYTVGGQVTVPCTGTAILCLELCDSHHSDLAKAGGAYLLKHPPAWHDMHFFYGIYYCSQATFQLGGNYWEFYRPRLHKLLFDQQQANGSWLNQQDGHYGTVYGTSMAVLALTVEYRYLPIYQRGDD